MTMILPLDRISDKLSFIGFLEAEATDSPCRSTEGDSSTSVLTSISNLIGPKVTSHRYSSEVKI